MRKRAHELYADMAALWEIVDAQRTENMRIWRNW